jgi:hypothetical protein
MLAVPEKSSGIGTAKDFFFHLVLCFEIAKSLFHGGNRGSNPLGDAKLLRDLRDASLLSLLLYGKYTAKMLLDKGGQRQMIRRASRACARTCRSLQFATAPLGVGFAIAVLFADAHDMKETPRIGDRAVTYPAGPFHPPDLDCPSANVLK